MKVLGEADGTDIAVGLEVCCGTRAVRPERSLNDEGAIEPEG